MYRKHRSIVRQASITANIFRFPSFTVMQLLIKKIDIYWYTGTNTFLLILSFYI